MTFVDEAELCQQALSIRLFSGRTDKKRLNSNLSKMRGFMRCQGAFPAPIYTFNQCLGELRCRRSGKPILFDGFFERDGNIVVIEVKILIDTRNVVSVVKNTLDRISALDFIQKSEEHLSILLAIVFDDAVKYSGNVQQALENSAKGSKIPVRIKLYSLPELEAEIGLTPPKS